MMLQSLLDLLVIEPERVQFAWLGALDRGQLPELVQTMMSNVRALGPLSWAR